MISVSGYPCMHAFIPPYFPSLVQEYMNSYSIPSLHGSPWNATVWLVSQQQTKLKLYTTHYLIFTSLAAVLSVMLFLPSTTTL
jgi:hypothetical protein